MGSPILSLIIPVYNKAPFLRRCLDSVAKQMREDVQVIVVDDASTDGSDKILLEYEQFDKIFNIQNGGVSAARNIGLEKAEAEAVAFLDADDELRDGALNLLVAYAGHIEKWPVIQFGHYNRYVDGRVKEVCALKGSYMLGELPKSWQMVWNKVYSMKALREAHASFNEDMGFGEDEVFNIDILSSVGKLWHAPESLMNHWLDDNNSICRGGSVDCEACQKLNQEVSKRIGSAKTAEINDWLVSRRNYLRGCTLFRNAGFNVSRTSDRDIVYLLKESPTNEELVYSLRSVEKNFAYNRVWFAGGKPNGVEPDRWMKIKQDAPSKWENVRNMLVEICKNDEISEDFWLFNDDFFVLKPCDDSLPQFYNGTLRSWIARCERKGGRYEYTDRLWHLVSTLERNGLPTLNYSIHTPILVNREKALEVLEKFPDEPMFRALYGNYWKIGGENHRDCKIRVLDKRADTSWLFCSSQDDSFHQGLIGGQIRDMFKYKSRFEV